MSNTPELKNLLKALKLSGILDHLDVRLMEAQNNELSFSELLAMILADEMEARRNRKLQRLITRVHLDPGKTLESFTWPEGSILSLTSIASMLSLRR
jgi:DNA replication protein DnaC